MPWLPSHIQSMVRPWNAIPYGRPIEIGADVWVGGAALILPGVRIGSRTVIGAGSVVTPDVPDGVFEAGTLAALSGRLPSRQAPSTA